MANYYGKIDTYTLKIETPNVHTNYKRVLYLKGSFGLAFVYFVQEGGQLGTNRKRPDRNVFDVYLWESAWNAVVDIVRNEKPVSFYYNSDSNTAYLYTGDEPIGEEES